ncbi:MAG: hypothetical protein E7626_05590 [Ruminococcaceae bacterium]|nr:hypothetical protein [Oscillospiraceae bacterium]
MKKRTRTYINIADMILMFFFGYCEVRVKDSFEKTLNALLTLGIRFTKMKNTDSGVSFLIYLGSRKKVSQILSDQDVVFSVSGAKGLPAPIIALSRRYGLVLGLLTVLTLCVVSERVVWEISVTGNETVKAAEIISDLERYGVRHGAYIDSLDTYAICTDYLLENDKLSWIRINAVGNRLQVVVREKNARPESEGERPSNLVAACDGLIYRVETLGGQRLVYGGESVLRGQILVSGLVDNELSGIEGVYIENPSYRFERSKGKVFAITSEQITVEIPMTVTEKHYTGENHQKKSLIFFSKAINFFLMGRNSYNSCDIIEVYKYIELPGEKVLPVCIKNTVFKEYVEREISLSESQAAELAEKELAEKISSLLGDEGTLLSKSVEAYCEDGIYTLKCSIGCIRDIAVETPLFSSDG